MTPGSPLDQLRDIHPPSEIGWWPIANTWWILLSLLLLIIVTLAITLVKRWRRNTWRRTALLELKELQITASEHCNNELGTNLSVLIKRCLASTNKATGILSLSGDSLNRELNATNGKHKLSTDIIDIVSYEIYKHNCPKIKPEHLINVESWIKGLNNV